MQQPSDFNFGVNYNRLLGKLYYQIGFNGNILTSDKGRWDRDFATLAAYPELAVGGPTFGWLRAAMQSIDQLNRWPKGQGPTCPTMIVMAGLDGVVDNKDTRAFGQRVPGFTLTSIPDSLHEILMERNQIRERFFAAFDSFIGQENIV